MKRVPVESSSLHAVAYLYEEQILEIEFHNSHVYQFYRVPVSVFFGLLNAESAGRYFNEEVKDHYRFRKIC